MAGGENETTTSAFVPMTYFDRVDMFRGMKENTGWSQDRISKVMVMMKDKASSRAVISALSTTAKLMLAEEKENPLRAWGYFEKDSKRVEPYITTALMVLVKDTLKMTQRAFYLFMRVSGNLFGQQHCNLYA